jgi:hypothetical protein
VVNFDGNVIARGDDLTVLKIGKPTLPVSPEYTVGDFDFGKEEQHSTSSAGAHVAND